jgi:L-threonylcarbamoyladenylate synthase
MSSFSSEPDAPRPTQSGRLSTRRLAADPASIADAAAVLRAGGLVAFATETVYGLGADATSDTAVAKIYAAKGRPSFNPLIAHVADLAAARRQAQFNADAEKLAEAFWPGPLTLVLPFASDGSVCQLARAGLDTIALRVPAHSIARALLTATGRPIAAPSANKSGHVSPVTAQHVCDDLDGLIDCVLDAGPTEVGLESTIVACLDGEVALLRPGGVAREAIEALLGRKLADPAPQDVTSDDAAPRAPGQLLSHYAPRSRVRLAARHLEAGEAGLDFAGQFGSGDHILDLSPNGNLTEAAANLFRHLRALDRYGAGTIAVAPIPETGLGEAINDRLRRAAADRP